MQYFGQEIITLINIIMIYAKIKPNHRGSTGRYSEPARGGSTTPILPCADIINMRLNFHYEFKSHSFFSPSILSTSLVLSFLDIHQEAHCILTCAKLVTSSNYILVFLDGSPRHVRSKRKCSLIDNLNDGSSPVLGLVGSSNACTTACSGKETEHGSSIDLGLSIKIKKPALDLELSLSTFSQGFIQSQGYVGLPALAKIEDDEISYPIDQNHVYTDFNPVNKKPRRKTRMKKCGFEGCVKGARGASGLCIGHGGGRRCQKADCHKGAEGKTIFCKSHGGGRRCHHLGCTKSAEGRTDHCIGHGGGRRCHHEGCTRAARGKTGMCIRHGGGKRCKVENCTKSAEGVSGVCIAHGGGRRCQSPNCTKGAQGSTMLCKAHGGGKRCTFSGCTKGAEGSTKFCKGHGGGKRCTSEGCTKSVHGATLFCVGHGGGKRCGVVGCTKSARGRTDFCVRHGGGKRCKFSGCGKSAQGSTDFCKAHGGGKRCSWGRLGLELGVVPCDKFARGKSGMCAAHGAGERESLSCLGMSNGQGTISIFGSVGCGNEMKYLPILQNSCLDRLSLPEGRVHGGSLMAMLRGGTSFAVSNGGRECKTFSHL
ncbi:probable WRKY transcription factor 19 [Phtheirospermum japonicum]|uniref:Probable WRKY transcription factor 19 n=1 Tax=Phtheirospermum japonicum TaxID=374723 RepID=A0A830C5D6_9LAMI|nr:probable WRKY transcription factor 19 [Phtheirospermum japonicum]